MENYLSVANSLNLFEFNDNPGSVLFKPNGALMYEKLKFYILKKHKKYGYEQVISPSLIKSNLLEISGHMEKYSEHIFSMQEENYCLRPMSCPNHIQIYMSQNKSFSDLPVKYFEFGQVFRNESSGALQSLFRMRQFVQDDSHLFVKEEDILQEISNYLLMAKEVYQELGFSEIEFFISLRPDKRFGDDNLWDRAENYLKLACEKNHLKYQLLENSGAFYGPKIEIQVKDKLNRSWQLGVIQLDYVLPQRFNLSYMDKEQNKQSPVILHHAVLGSLERMIGILLESFGFNIPDFIHPYEHVVICVSEKSKDYAQIVYKYLSENLDVKLDISDEKIGKKIAKYKSLGACNIYVVGEKEYEQYKKEGQIVYNLNKKKIS